WFMLMMMSNSSSIAATKSITVRLSNSRSPANVVSSETSTPFLLNGSINARIRLSTSARSMGIPLSVGGRLRLPCHGQGKAARGPACQALARRPAAAEARAAPERGLRAPGAASGKQAVDRCHERADRDGLGQIAFGADFANPLLVALAGISGDGEHRHVGQRGVLLEVGDQVEPRHVLELDVHDHQVGEKAACFLDRIVAVRYRFDGETAGLENVAEKLTIEVVVLDNEDSLRHCAPDAPTPRERFATFNPLTDN